ncbi:MAG: hypothetical protein D6786_06500, partial [Gammaproteobacteria bacterium]
MLCASLDNWFPEASNHTVDEKEFIVEEWRLKERLGVDHFRLPPDFRKKGEINRYLTVPAFRFPQWHFCPRCGRMRELPLSVRGRVTCEHCKNAKEKFTVEMYQVRFIMICDHGHIHDFPWREWVHRDPSPTCGGELKLLARGGASLASIFVKCEACGKRRSLDRITLAYNDGNTHLSANLAKNHTYTCPGKMPWAGSDARTTCNRPVRGSLRNASNVYFAELRSSLYLPQSDDRDLQELIELLEQPKFTTVRALVSSGALSLEHSLNLVRESGGMALKPFSDSQLKKALKSVVIGGGEFHREANEGPVPSDSEETGYRRVEFNVLRRPLKSDQLTIRDPGLEAYEKDIQPFFSRIMLVDRLRETRALAGFTRILPEG